MEITKHPEFKVIHINGVFGSLGPDEGRITFYTDIVEPRIKTGGQFGEVETEKINREIQVEIRVSTMTFISIAQWMDAHIKDLEAKGILKKEEKSQSKQNMYRS
jgi:hypothetical protein